VEALTAHDALRRAVSSPADTLTHFAVGYAVAKSGHLRIAILLLSRQAAVAAASVAATVHAHESATSLAVYADELERSGAEALVLTVEAAPEVQLLGARIAVVDGSASAASQQQLASTAATPLAGIAAAAEEQSLEHMAASWRQLQRPAFESDAAAWSTAPDAAAAAAAGATRAVVFPWQLQRTGGDGGSARRVGVPLPAALLRAAAAAAGGTVLVQLVGAAAGSDAAATAPFSAPDAAFTAANLAVPPPAALSAGAAAPSGFAALQSPTCFPIRFFESRAADTTASTLLALGVGAVSHSESGSAAASRRASLLPPSASAAAGALGASAATARASVSTLGGGASVLPGGLRVPPGAPTIAAAPRSGAFSSLSVVASAAAAAAVTAGSRLQHLRADTVESAPLTLLLPLSVALEAVGGGSGTAGSGSVRAGAADSAVSRLMLVSGASEEDALASAPDGFDLLPLNLAELVRQQLASGSTGASTGAFAAGSGASSRSGGSVACTVHPAAVYIAVQRGGGVAPAQPLLDAGLFVALGVSAASGTAAAAAPDAAGSGSSEAQLLLPSIDAPAGYTLQIKDVSVAVETSSDADAGGGEGKRGDGGEDGEEEAPGARPTVGVRIALLSCSDAEAVAAAIGSGSGPVSVRLTDHHAATDASSRLASGRGAGAEAAAGAGAAAASSRGADSSSRTQQQRLQMDADGVVGSGGEPADGSRAGPGGRDGDAAASSAAGTASGRVSALLAAGTGGSRAPSGAESPEDGSEEGGPRAPPAAPPLSAGSARKVPPAPPARKPAAPPAALNTGGGAGGRGLAGGEPGSDRHRQQLLELLQAALAEQERLGSSNAVLQRQLAIYFSLRHSDDDAKDGGAGGAGGGAGSKNAAAAAFAAADKDRRYREQLDSVATDRERLATLLSQSEQEATELQSRVEEKEGRCGQLLRAFGDFKHQIAAAAVNSHTGRHIPPEELARYEAMERDRDAEVSRVQLRHLHLSSQVAKLTDQLKRRDRVADGLAMMDFEQLKIENSTLSERIEDRSEELAKLKKKATVAVQILTHVREKLHFVQAEAARLAAELQVVEDEVTDQRAVLASAKHERDRFRAEMEKASHAQGFAHNDRLAIDFERRKRDIVALRDRLEATRDRWQRLADVAADRSALLETVMAGGGGTYAGGGGAGFGASVGAGGLGGASAGPAAYAATGGTAAGGFGRSTMGGTGGAAVGATGKAGAGSAALGYGRPPVGGASASGRR
jgi:hypothetical protein